MAPKTRRKGRRSLSAVGRARPAGCIAAAELHAEETSSHTDENIDDVSMQPDALQKSPAWRDPDLLVPIYVRDLVRGKQRVRLYSNPLGAASFHLDKEGVVKSVAALKASNLLEVGLLFVSEVRSCVDDGYDLSAIERRFFSCEMGCPPLLLLCHACGAELERLRGQPGALQGKEKEVQQLAAEIAEILLESGAKIEVADVGPQGNTALHLAATYGAADLLSALLRMGAQVSVTNKAGRSAELVASSGGHTLCEQILQVVAMLQMDKYAVELKRMVDAEDNIKRKKQKKQSKTQNKVQQRQQVDRPSDNHGQVSPALSGVEKEEESKGRLSKKAADEGGPCAPYGPNGFWSKLNEDAEPPNEWDVEAWDEYEDWGEDWHADADNNDEGPEISGDEDEQKVRAEVARLRRAKAERLQQLRHLAAEHEQCAQEVEELQEKVLHSDERAKHLEECEVRLQNGDQTAKDDLSAAECKVSAWWEKRATANARAVWELEKQLTQQEKAQRKEREQLEKQWRNMMPKTEIEEIEAEVAKELQDLVAAKQKQQLLSEDLLSLRDDLPGVSKQLKARLPPLLQPDGEGGGVVPPARKLLEAVRIHREIQERVRTLKQISHLCNQQRSSSE